MEAVQKTQGRSPKDVLKEQMDTCVRLYEERFRREDDNDWIDFVC